METEVMPVFPWQLRAPQPQMPGLKPYLRYTALSPFLPQGGSPGLPEGLPPTNSLIFTTDGERQAHTIQGTYHPVTHTGGMQTPHAADCVRGALWAPSAARQTPAPSACISTGSPRSFKHRGEHETDNRALTAHHTWLVRTERCCKYRMHTDREDLAWENNVSVSISFHIVITCWNDNISGYFS